MVDDSFEKFSGNNQETIRDYHKKERDRLDELVGKGMLQELRAGNGSMYVLPLPTGDFPVAISVRDLIVRSGDEVHLARPGVKGSLVETTAPIADFEIDPGNNEIVFNHSISDISAMLRVQDIMFNNSATVRLERSRRR